MSARLPLSKRNLSVHRAPSTRRQTPGKTGQSRGEEEALGPAARVAVELTEEAALALVAAIQAALAGAPPGLASATA